jgi:hypothetical protein
MILKFSPKRRAAVPIGAAPLLDDETLSSFLADFHRLRPSSKVLMARLASQLLKAEEEVVLANALYDGSPE